MSLLFFTKPMQRAILAGRKVTTIRRWDRPRVKAGGRAWAAGIGWLAVDAVEPVALADLTDADAAADGFGSLAALLAVLRELYPAAGSADGAAAGGGREDPPPAGDGKRWFRVRFHLPDPPPPSPQGMLFDL